LSTSSLFSGCGSSSAQAPSHPVSQSVQASHVANQAESPLIKDFAIGIFAFSDGVQDMISSAKIAEQAATDASKSAIATANRVAEAAEQAAKAQASAIASGVEADVQAATEAINKQADLLQQQAIDEQNSAKQALQSANSTLELLNQQEQETAQQLANLKTQREEAVAADNKQAVEDCDTKIKQVEEIQSNIAQSKTTAEANVEKAKAASAEADAKAMAAGDIDALRQQCTEQAKAGKQ
jgi:hypothetical protein